MTNKANLAASVAAGLLNRAKQMGDDYPDRGGERALGPFFCE